MTHPKWKRLSFTRARRLSRAIAIYRARREHSNEPDPQAEQLSCCKSIQPHSLKRHCRTIKHIANLLSVDPVYLRRGVRNDDYDEWLFFNYIFERGARRRSSARQVHA